MTLDLLGQHYSINSDPPPPPPRPPGAILSPPPPPPPACSVTDGAEDGEDPDMYPCEVPIEPGVVLQYAADRGDTLRASLRCDTCPGWVAIAVIGTSAPASSLSNAAAVVGSFGATAAAKPTWQLSNLASAPYQSSSDAVTFSKTSGGKGYNAAAVTTQSAISEVEVIGEYTGNRNAYMRFCLTTQPSDGPNCDNGAMLGLFPKGKLFTGCWGKDLRRLGATFKTGDVLSIKFDASSKQLLLRKNSELLRLCSTDGAALPSGGFYAKTFLFHNGLSLKGVRATTATVASAMVKRHTLTDGGCNSATSPIVCTSSVAPELPLAQQTLRETSLERLKNGATMTFIAPRSSLLGGRFGTFHATLLKGTSSTFNINEPANRSNFVLSVDTPPAVAPPPPPLLAVAQPPPMALVCGDGSASALSGYPCTLQLDGRMTLHYLLTGTGALATLKAHLVCSTCRGWLGLGFPAVPRAMLGATAIIGVPGNGAEVAVYGLNGKAPSAVQKMDATVQAGLRESSVRLDSDGMALSFTVTLGEAGVPASLNTVDLIYAAGPTANLGYHLALRGSKRTKFYTLPAPPVQHVVRVSFKAAGDVASFAPGSAAANQIKAKHAEIARVRVEDVTLEVTAGSVSIGVTVAVSNAEAASTLTTSIQSAMTSPESATALLGVPVQTVPVVETKTIVAAAAPMVAAPPALPPSTPDVTMPTNNGTAGVAVADALSDAFATGLTPGTGWPVLIGCILSFFAGAGVVMLVRRYDLRKNPHRYTPAETREAGKVGKLQEPSRFRVRGWLGGDRVALRRTPTGTRTTDSTTYSRGVVSVRSSSPGNARHPPPQTEPDDHGEDHIAQI